MLDQLAAHALELPGDDTGMLQERRPGRGQLDAAPVALGRLILRRILTEASGGKPVSFAHVEAARRLGREGGASIDLPGQRMERVGPDVVLRSRPPDAVGRPSSSANLFRYPLSIPGEVCLAESGCAVTAEPASSVLLE